MRRNQQLNRQTCYDCWISANSSTFKIRLRPYTQNKLSTNNQQFIPQRIPRYLSTAAFALRQGPDKSDYLTNCIFCSQRYRQPDLVVKRLSKDRRKILRWSPTDPKTPTITKQQCSMGQWRRPSVCRNR